MQINQRVVSTGPPRGLESNQPMLKCATDAMASIFGADASTAGQRNSSNHQKSSEAPTMRKPITVYTTLLALVVAATAVVADEATDARNAAMEQIRAAGGQVMEIAQNDKRLDVAFHLADREITDEALTPVAQLPDVIQLNLRGTAITDAGLAKIAGMTSLLKLHLENTKITDAGLPSLKGLTNLEYLNVFGTPITDASIDTLAQFKSLKKLYIWQTGITLDGYNKLKAALPELDVVPNLIEEKKKAEAAIVAAADAQKAADGAKAAAEAAKQQADAQLKAVEEVQKQAAEVEKKAADAQKLAEDAAKLAALVKADADAAKQKVADAQKVADEAKKAAEESQKKAEESQKSAESAKKRAEDLNPQLAAQAAPATAAPAAAEGEKKE